MSFGDPALPDHSSRSHQADASVSVQGAEDLSEGLRSLQGQTWGRRIQTKLDRVLKSLESSSANQPPTSLLESDQVVKDVVLCEVLKRVRNPTTALALVAEWLDVDERLARLERRARWSWFYPLGLLTLTIVVLSFFLLRFSQLDPERELAPDGNWLAEPRLLPIPISFFVFSCVLTVTWIWYLLWATQGLRAWLPSISWIPISERTLQAVEGSRLAFALTKLYEVKVPSREAYELLRANTRHAHFRNWLDEVRRFEESGSLRQEIRSFHPWSPLPDVELLKHRDSDSSAFYWRATGEHLEATAADRLAICGVLLPVLTYLLSASLIYQAMRYVLRWSGTLSDLTGATAAGLGTFSMGGLAIFPLAFTWLTLVWLRHTMPNSPFQRRIRRFIGFGVIVLAGLCGILTALTFVPAAIGAPLSLAMFVVVIVLVRVQASSDRASAMRALRFAMNHQLPIEVVAEHLGKNRTNGFGSQLLQLAHQLRLGADLATACTKSRLSLTEAKSSPLGGIDASDLGRRSGLARAGTGAYLIGVWLMMVGVSVGIGLFVLPTFEKMLEEFSDGPIEMNTMFKLTQKLPFVYAIFIQLGILYLGLWILPKLGASLPLYGAMFQKRRANLLFHLADDLRQQRPLNVSQLQRSYHTSSMLFRLNRLLDSGVPFPQALGKSGMVHPHEVAWLETAQQTGRLGQVLEYIARQVSLDSQLHLERWTKVFTVVTYAIAGATVAICALGCWGGLLKVLEFASDTIP